MGGVEEEDDDDEEVENKWMRKGLVRDLCLGLATERAMKGEEGEKILAKKNKRKWTRV